MDISWRKQRKMKSIKARQNELVNSWLFIKVNIRYLSVTQYASLSLTCWNLEHRLQQNEIPRSLLHSDKKRALFSGLLTWTNFVKNENSLRIRVQTISIFNQSYSAMAVTSQVEFAFKVFQHREAPEAHELKNIALVISPFRFLEIEDSVELEIILTTGIL